jgi:hypothetical protein
MDTNQMIENQIEKNQSSGYDKDVLNFGKTRQLLKHIISVMSTPINIIDNGYDDGDIKFFVLKKDIDISSEFFTQYKNEIMSDFVVNFIGELLVRENIDKFTKILMGVERDEYESLVNRFEHRKCGVQVFSDRFIYSFHISLIQKILTEDFKRETLRVK